MTPGGYKKIINSIIALVLIGVLWTIVPSAQVHAQQSTESIESDSTVVEDSISQTPSTVEDTQLENFNPEDRPGLPYLYRTTESPMFLKDPSNLQMDVEIDTGMNYHFEEKMGDLYYRPPTQMSFEEFNQIQDARIRREYWKQRSAGLDGESAVSSRRLIPPIYVSPVFDRLFGGSYVDIQPNGFVTLDFGGKWQRVQNPALSLRHQRNGGFEFDMAISMNVVGSIGDKLKVTANFDNNNSFDFQNNLKVEYTGYEEEILQKLEIGNVSLPLNNSLISGAQNLFGVKTQLRFGRLYVTALASTQRGKSDKIEISTNAGGGGQGRDFEIRATDYEENRNFFLGHFFKENYEKWLSGLPNINSTVNITRVEVYVVNSQNNTQDIRNFIAFMDLGEGQEVYRSNNPRLQPLNGNVPTDNNANGLFNALKQLPGLREPDQANNILDNDFQFQQSTDYENKRSARKLDEREYTINPQLGTISLQRRLKNDEVLAVAYEYRHGGKLYKVGELADDYGSRPETQAIFLKMLRPGKINPRVPTWDLMMKNVYSLNASQVTRDGFQLRVIYRDDKSGLDNPSLHEGGAKIKDIPLIELFGLDRLNANNDPQKDGNFDFVEGVTILPEYGQIIFPVLEPFGSKLRSYFNPDTEGNLIEKYVFDSLYRSTKSDAEQDMQKNKFYITGMMQAGSASEIVLPGINVSEGSVVVTAGNIPLQEGTQYRVDYNMGRVIILDEAVLNSGKPISISFEKADLFNFQTRSLLGTRLDYKLSDDINFGATMLYHNERPLISRVSIGDEPNRNVKYGFDVNFSKESRLLTRAVDFLPLIETKAPSSVSFNAEFAQILPGTSNKVNGEGTSYIDDFESTATPFSLGNNILSWKLAATPERADNKFMPNGNVSNDLSVGYRRARLSWFIIDNIFYYSTGQDRPTNISDVDRNNEYVRPVAPQEIFKERQSQVIEQNLPVLNLAYFPNERGPYNFNPNLAVAGETPILAEEARNNYGGITRAIKTDVDFDRNNIEYIEFWLLDPFIQGENGKVIDGVYNQRNSTGGKLFFNLGSVSEDVMKDNLHAFENGLPASGDTTGAKIDANEWGIVTRQQLLTNAFDNSESARKNQDIGMDGLNSTAEATYFSDYINGIGISGSARDKVLEDPSGDDFKYFLGADLDQNDVKILERYKRYNNTENNSPVASGTSNYTPSGTNLPDKEDLNDDNTLSDLEEYYEYEIDLRPGQLRVGSNYIVDKVTNNRNGVEVSWYQFKIPIRKPSRIQGGINGFKSIKYIRTYLTDFSQPVVLRFVNFQMVGSQWRRYPNVIYERGLYERPENETDNFNVSVVNLEDNGASGNNKIPYVLPPGIERDPDNTSSIYREVNEQSMVLTVKNLKDRTSRGVIKNLSLDLIHYGRLKMFISAQELNDIPLQDSAVHAFLRLGKDQDNFYEISLPLHVTRVGATTREDIWPKENEIDIAFDDLLAVKSVRDRSEVSLDVPFTQKKGKYYVTVKGKPQLSRTEQLMIGIKNPEGQPDEMPQSVMIWVNELRVTEFDKTPGWAANAYFNTKLADFANLNASARFTSFGYSDLQQKIGERTKEQMLQYDVSASVNLDKFFPSKFGLRVPMYVGYEKTTSTPYYNPLDPDVRLEAALKSFDTEQEKAEFKDLVIDQTVRRSINFSNVGKEKTKEDAKDHIYDIENFSVTYAYSDTRRSNYQIESYLNKTYSGSLDYNFSPQPPVFEPFKKSEKLKSDYLKLVKDFNVSLLPDNLSFRTDLDRRFIRTQYRNNNYNSQGVAPTWEKFFNFNRFYNLRWGLTKSLSFDYSANVTAVVDELPGDVVSDTEKDYIVNNLKNMGRMRMFDQRMGATYKVPIDKIPLLDWTQAEARYSVGYNWIAGAYSPVDSLNLQKRFGNVIQNNREMGATARLDFVQFYNKNKYLKSINSPPRRRTQGRTTTAPNVKEDTVKTTVGEMKAVKGIARLLMSLRNVSGTLNVRDATMLPGFSQTPFLLGMDRDFEGPGWGFILGQQNSAYRYAAAERGWLARDTLLTTPYNQTRNIELTIDANIEPFKDLKIKLNARKSMMGSFEELFKVRTFGTGDDEYYLYNGLAPSRSGSFSTSFSIIRTAFVKDDGQNNSPIFKKFEEYRSIILNRMPENNNAYYSLNSQDVMVPAFIAAYTGKDPNGVSLNPFPKIPIPGWTVDFAGLGNLEIFKESFSSINVKHGYKSNYSVNNYVNNLKYEDGLELASGLDYYQFASETNDLGELVPFFMFNNVIITEEFSPLIGISLRTKNRLTARVDYKKKRELGLSLSNSQVTEIRSNDVSFEIGYTKAKMKMPFRVQGRVISLENDLSFKLNFTIRDTKTVQRRIEDEQTVTSGNINYQFRPQISYVLSERLNLNLYFERNVNTPRITNSYPRSTTSVGIQIRFSLAQ